MRHVFRRGKEKTTYSVSGNESISRNFYLIVGLFVIIIASTLALDRFQAYLLNAVRTYVAGEGYWSKGQKDAISHLQRYAATHNDNQYHLFQQGLAVSLGDRKGRLALQSPHPDLSKAREGFLAGNNSPKDVPTLISFFLYFNSVGPMKKAISIWTEGDKKIDTLIKLGQKLHHTLSSGSGSNADIQNILERVFAINSSLTTLEIQFSDTLENAAREVRSLTGLAMFVSTLLMLSIGIFLATRLIRNVHRVEMEITLSEARFRHIVESNIMGIAFWDNEGNIVDANDAYLETIGYTRDDLRKGRINWRELTPEEYREQDAKAVRQIQEHGHFSAYEKEYIKKDGERIAILIGAARFNEDGGVGLILDISARKSLELHQQQIQKMEAISTLVGGIAHDFNNTLTATVGNLFLAKEYAKDNPKLLEKLEEIESLGAHSAEVVQKLLVFANTGVIRLEEMSLNNLCKRISRMIPAGLTEGVSFDIDICDEEQIIKGDLAQLELVITHLLKNACEAVAHTKTASILFRLSNYELDESFRSENPNLSQGKVAHIQVRDNGYGMSNEQLEHVFEPFFTTKKGKGAGLGLAMAYGSMKTHRGLITIDSTLMLGTSVNLYLPRIEKLIII